MSDSTIEQHWPIGVRALLSSLIPGGVTFSVSLPRPLKQAEIEAMIPVMESIESFVALLRQVPPIPARPGPLQ